MLKKVGIALLVIAGFAVFHIGMMKDQASLCDRGAMEGKECQD